MLALTVPFILAMCRLRGAAHSENSAAGQRFLLLRHSSSNFFTSSQERKNEQLRQGCGTVIQLPPRVSLSIFLVCQDRSSRREARPDPSPFQVRAISGAPRDELQDPPSAHHDCTRDLSPFVSTRSATCLKRSIFAPPSIFP